MQTSNAKHNFSSDDPVWILLAELSLRDFLSDIDRREGLTAGYLLQTVQELDVPAECVETITRLVAEFAKESPLNYKQEGMEFPGRIRMLCQKKLQTMQMQRAQPHDLIMLNKRWNIHQ